MSWLIWLAYPCFYSFTICDNQHCYLAQSYLSYERWDPINNHIAVYELTSSQWWSPLLRLCSMFCILYCVCSTKWNLYIKIERNRFGTSILTIIEKSNLIADHNVLDHLVSMWMFVILLFWYLNGCWILAL